MNKFNSFFGAFLISYSISGQTTVNANLTFNSSLEVSPLIFGFNQDHEDIDSSTFTIRRLGGNRMSAFNWENGSSAGDKNGTILNNSRIDFVCDVPHANHGGVGLSYEYFHNTNLDAGVESIITVPIMPYVAADNGKVFGEANLTLPPSNRWDKLVIKKNSPFASTPDLTDATVYMDESINYLVDKFGLSTTASGVKYIAIDNEPGYWWKTHKATQPVRLSAKAYTDSVIKAAIAIKEIDPNIKIIVGEFAQQNMYDIQSSDWATVGAGYEWFVDYLLDRLKTASDNVGYNLVDYVSFHYYAIAQVNSSGKYTAGTPALRFQNSTAAHIRKARLDYARSLWDDTFIEESFLTNGFGQFFRYKSTNFINRVQKSIDTYFPGVEIMIGEWDCGFDTDIAHGIAIADALGAMSQYGVSIANRWDLQVYNSNTYTTPAFQLYRNFYKKGSTLNKVVTTDFDNRDINSVWASLNEETQELHLIILNKEQNDSTDFKINLNSDDFNTTVKSIKGFTSGSKVINDFGNLGNIENGDFEIKLPALSAYHVTISRELITSQREIVKDQPLISATNISGLTGEWIVLNSVGQVVAKGNSNILTYSNFTTGVYFLQQDNSCYKFIVSNMK